MDFYSRLKTLEHLDFPERKLLCRTALNSKVSNYTSQKCPRQILEVAQVTHSLSSSGLQYTKVTAEGLKILGAGNILFRRH